MVKLLQLSPDLVVHRCQISDRPSLVVLPDLAAGFLQENAWLGDPSKLDSYCDDLWHCDALEYSRRLVYRISNQHRLECHPGTQDRNANVRCLRSADSIRDESRRLERGAAHWP